jgi:Holliday junction DNA helicase RuvB
MEDYRIDIVLDSGPQARTITVKLEPFTLIGATTRVALLSRPLLARFGIHFRLEYYDIEALKKIVLRSALLMGIRIEEEGALEIAMRSRGTPRIANRLLRRVRDFAEVAYNGVITRQVAQEALDRLGIDQLGLDEMDKRILRSIIERYGGGPVGLKTIASLLGEDEGTIEEVYEPYLLMRGFLERTPRGRKVTTNAYQIIGSQ